MQPTNQSPQSNHVSSSLNQQSLPLPSPSMQNQIHELAKSLPPPRKQNIACDACRQRKVKCHQLPGQLKCQHCMVKNYPCTHHAQQATTEKKRISSVSRRPRAYSTSNQRCDRTIFPLLDSTSDLPSSSPSVPKACVSTDSIPPFAHSQRTPPTSNYPPSTASPSSPFRYPTPSFHPPIRRNTSFTELLAYLFSPPDDPRYVMINLSSPVRSALTPYMNTELVLSSRTNMYISPSYQMSPYKNWGELAYKLEEESFRVEFALDLVEVYFQIVHTRLPFLNPTHFRARLNVNVPQATAGQYTGGGGGVTEDPLHPALMATVIAWGAKFSEHSLLVADRAQNRMRQSALAKTLINRAREVAEALKVHRVPAAEHVVIALLIEPLQSQELPDDASGYRGFWLTSAIRQLFDLQINHKSVISNIQDPEARGTMIFAWWMACLSDAYGAAYYRRKPALEDSDYDIDFYTVDPVQADSADSHVMKPDPREHLEFRASSDFLPPSIQGYYRAAHALARISRHMSKNLWIPSTDSEGIPAEVLRGIMDQLNEWKDHYLPQVGVPTNFAAEWDFVSAVSACASDATFHIMWIILFGALDDFGVREINEAMRIGSPGHIHPNYHQIEEMKRKVLDEALHGALRIAGLAGVLTKNGYLVSLNELHRAPNPRTFPFSSSSSPYSSHPFRFRSLQRLDPAVMHVSCNQAGTLLARFGRPEVQNCIEGLEQYSYSYEEAAEQAADLRRLYTLARSGEGDFNHMTSVIHQQQQQPHPHAPVHPHAVRMPAMQMSVQQVHVPMGDTGMYVDAGGYQ
ncbi:hypothetical protein EW146_g8729 [Bondarzewia mesenterica]|uniref:Zn(2)-C6 fungal-type domain-containing protein n=1 Tax=Bondarzewia mesenterica TaxID=1095465 RepID=A0A4S4LCG8_9AGAM|nr:hypothetical protein EW146_g8729 [Bondarzewia mesenterica]